MIRQLRRGELLGSGSTRKVYALGERYVIKIANNGRYANKAEVANYHHLRKKRLGKLLAPILAFDPDGKWLIQERAQNTHDATSCPRDCDVTHLQAIIDKLDREGLTDSCCFNYGQIDGRWVCLDYAS